MGKKAPMGVGSLFSSGDMERANRETKWMQAVRQTRACVDCPLSTAKGCAGPMAGQGNYQRPLIAFVLEAPGPKDSASGIILDPGSPGGRLFDRMLAAMGMRRDQTLLLYAVSCSIPDTCPADDWMLQACAKNMEAQLQAADPHTIVACGWAAAAALLGHSYRIEEQHQAWRLCFGQWQFWKGYPWRAINHPSSMVTAPRSRQESLNELVPVMERLEKAVPSSYRMPDKFRGDAGDGGGEAPKGFYH